jgi:hypothetical protein
MKTAEVNQSQLDILEFALRIADFWLDGQEPSEQLKLDRQDVEEAYSVIQQLRFDLNGR